MRAPYLATPVRRPDQLTPAQRAVLVLLADGATNDQIARALGLSRQTVKEHTILIYARMPGPTLGNPRVIAARWHWEAERAA